ncbi:membrane-bound lytic murein transglycosylase MltF [Inmirania thermothiophila]|uniref:Membrane-bound lytic murein transglycosylase F n=1 Tax=Inmirania thermothiophila TaxID=1750597 RepID=A0A3N1Y7U9_9GAMM|nr:membrane-bound lytic murein transglycosylase MltF [Inmirania thermothiophila]ROR34894.1 membrane-bound lytic murein transglycosylase F [Inmirania thermothiophila]
MKLRAQIRRSAAPALGAALLLSCAAAQAPAPERDPVTRIRAAGLLRVAVPAPAAEAAVALGPAGMDRDLAAAFAERLGVRMEPVRTAGAAEALARVRSGEADLAAVAMPVVRIRAAGLRPGPVHRSGQAVVVARRGGVRPADLGALHRVYVEAAPGGTGAAALEAVRAAGAPQLLWTEPGGTDDGAVLRRLAEGRAEAAVVDAASLAHHRAFLPGLRAAFELGSPIPLAWALPAGSDTGLAEALADFFDEAFTGGLVAQIEDRHLGHTAHVHPLEIRALRRRLARRLPRYRDLFVEAARRTGMDWRLLAAVGYQESAWNPRAVSPTGVRGIMMLTLATAARVGVASRLDPAESIFGGARHLRSLHERLPASVREPDRTWMALAAYNVGLGHLLDARALAERRGLDPDRWVDVRDTLPLLSRRAWYARTRYGFARGEEAVVYVERIRLFYQQLLRWLDPALAS